MSWEGLQDFVTGWRNLDVDVSHGYPFRIVAEDTGVYDQPVTYSVIWNRLWVSMDEGETPHFRTACAVSLAMSSSVHDIGQTMRHVGCFGGGSAEYYGRMPV